LIIAFEGIDGSGKDSVIKRLIERFSKRGITAKSFYIVGGSELANRIRDIMFDPDIEMSGASRELFYSIIRTEVFAEAERYDRENPDHVIIFNRTIISSLIYQGMCSQDWKSVRRIADFYSASVNYEHYGSVATDIMEIFYLKISVETSMKRDEIGCDYDHNNQERLKFASNYYNMIFNRDYDYTNLLNSIKESKLIEFLNRTNLITIDAEQELEKVVNDIEEHLIERYPAYYR